MNKDENKIELWEVLVPTIRNGNGKPFRTRFHRVCQLLTKF